MPCAHLSDLTDIELGSFYRHGGINSKPYSRRRIDAGEEAWLINLKRSTVRITEPFKFGPGMADVPSV
jgi:hypothetical protein